MMSKLPKSRFQRFLDSIHVPNWVVLILTLQLLLRIPSFFEPFYYGDEMISLSLGEGIRRGLTLYRDLFADKPPLIYYTAAISGNVFWFRAILAAWMMGTTILFWKLLGRLFPKNIAVVRIALVVFALLTALPLLEGQIANAELFILAPTIVAFLLILKRGVGGIKMFGAGVLFGIATLFKVTAAFDLVVGLILIVSAVMFNREGISSSLKNIAIVLTGFALPVAITFIWYALQGVMGEYVVAVYLQNTDYLSSWRSAATEQFFLGRSVPLLTRSAIAAGAMVLLMLFRSKLSVSYILSVTWLITALFGATFLEQPQPLHFIQAVPPIAILTGILFARKNIEQVLVIFPLLGAAAVPVYYNFRHNPAIPYYVNFIEFAAGSIDRSEYFDQFDRSVNGNYVVARYIVSSTAADESIFTWGDSAQSVYALSRRLPPVKYVATHQIQDFSSKSEILTILQRNNPGLIIILPDSPPFPELIQFLNSGYIEVFTVDEARIWRYMPRITQTLSH